MWFLYGVVQRENTDTDSVGKNYRKEDLNGIVAVDRFLSGQRLGQDRKVADAVKGNTLQGDEYVTNIWMWIFYFFFWVWGLGTVLNSPDSMILAQQLRKRGPL